MLAMMTDLPRTLASADEIAARRAMLAKPHLRPLTAYVRALRQSWQAEVPDFDPVDGGVEARALFLFEKPGPMTSLTGERLGSGFISRDNDDPTAENTFNFMRQADVPRGATVLWNSVPAWNGTRKISAAELRKGIDGLYDLLSLLPRLRVIVLVGKKAQRSEALLAPTGLPILTSAHPSPLVRASFPDRWRSIPQEWAAVREFI